MKRSAPIADVTVVAPATQQSAVGRSISIFEPIRANEVTDERGAAYAVGGKPTDRLLSGCMPSFSNRSCVSGINIGENLSLRVDHDIGTVGAALEASNQGTPAIAFSLQVEDQGDKFDDPRDHCQSFEDAKTVVREYLQYLPFEEAPGRGGCHQREHPFTPHREVRGDTALAQTVPDRS